MLIKLLLFSIKHQICLQRVNICFIHILLLFSQFKNIIWIGLNIARTHVSHFQQMALVEQGEWVMRSSSNYWFIKLQLEMKIIHQIEIIKQLDSSAPKKLGITGNAKGLWWSQKYLLLFLFTKECLSRKNSLLFSVSTTTDCNKYHWIDSEIIDCDFRCRVEWQRKEIVISWCALLTAQTCICVSFVFDCTSRRCNNLLGSTSREVRESSDNQFVSNATTHHTHRKRKKQEKTNVQMIFVVETTVYYVCLGWYNFPKKEFAR